jgi:transcriptional regulator with XRE-family HTH domain
MESIRQRRLQRGLTQKQLAALLGVPRQRISEYERGRRLLPRPLLVRLEGLLHSSDLVGAEWFLSAQDRQRLGQVSRWAIQVDEGWTWATLPPKYAQVYRQMGPLSHTPPLSFRRLVRCDSALEILAWTLLVEFGFGPVLASPVALGFLSLSLIDGQGQALGNRFKAALHYRSAQGDVLLWPQVTLLGLNLQRRVDALLLTRAGFSLLEIDGGAHTNREWDRLQDERLPIAVHRFEDQDIVSQAFPQLLLDRLGVQGGMPKA